MAQRRDDDQWRDERRLTNEELTNAMAVYSTDGQADDTTGGDAGAQAQYGESAAESVDSPEQENFDIDAQYAPDAPGPRAGDIRSRPGPESRRGPDSG